MYAEHDDETETITARAPRNPRERTMAALCSSDEDLYPDDNGRVIVTGKLPNGDIIYLGHVSEVALYTARCGPRVLLDHVRFGRARVRRP